MHLRLPYLAAPALALASWMSACSSSPASDSATKTPGAKVDAGPAPSTLANGCPDNSGYVGDTACLAAPPSTQGFQLHYGPGSYEDASGEAAYVLPASGETNDCFYLKTPNTSDVYVGGYEFSMRPGSHHLNIDVNPTAQPDGFATCGANDQSPGLLGGTETPKVDELMDPAPENAGLATLLPANSQAVLNFHVINTSSEPILREAWLNYMYMNASDVKALRGNLFLVGGVGFQITPGTNQTYTYSCTPDRPVRIISMAAHMHAHATRMSAWKVSGGAPTLVYETYNWYTPTELHFDTVHTNVVADPATQTGGGMSGPLTISPGESIQWECAVDNTSDVTLTFRNEVYTGEMCIMTGEVVPTDDPMSQYDFTCTKN